MKPFVAALIILGIMEAIVILSGVTAAGRGEGVNSQAGAWLGQGIVLAIGWAIWFLPVIIAHYRNRLNSGPIFVIVLLLSWTIIGWVVALAMAAGGTTTKTAQTS